MKDIPLLELRAYWTLNPLSPDLVEMSECSMPETEAADGPLFKCWTNSLIPSSLP
jgi:hypothetical protein